MMNAVGGTSIFTHYANSWRFHPWDFEARSQSIKRYGANSIPAGTTLEDWPVTYSELEPYYDRIEYEIGVAGKAGNIQGKIDRAGNVFEGARQRELLPCRLYALPDRTTGSDAVPAARKLGWNPHLAPAAINSQPHAGRAACAYRTAIATRADATLTPRTPTAITTISGRAKDQEPEDCRKSPCHAHLNGCER